MGSGGGSLRRTTSEADLYIGALGGEFSERGSSPGFSELETIPSSWAREAGSVRDTLPVSSTLPELPPMTATRSNTSLLGDVSGSSHRAAISAQPRTSIVNVISPTDSDPKTTTSTELPSYSSQPDPSDIRMTIGSIPTLPSRPAHSVALESHHEDYGYDEDLRSQHSSATSGIGRGFSDTGGEDALSRAEEREPLLYEGRSKTGSEHREEGEFEEAYTIRSMEDKSVVGNIAASRGKENMRGVSGLQASSLYQQQQQQASLSPPFGQSSFSPTSQRNPTRRFHQAISVTTVSPFSDSDLPLPDPPRSIHHHGSASSLVGGNNSNENINFTSLRSITQAPSSSLSSPGNSGGSPWPASASQTGARRPAGWKHSGGLLANAKAHYILLESSAPPSRISPEVTSPISADQSTSKLGPSSVSTTEPLRPRPRVGRVVYGEREVPSESLSRDEGGYRGLPSSSASATSGTYSAVTSRSVASASASYLTATEKALAAALLAASAASSSSSPTKSNPSASIYYTAPQAFNSHTETSYTAPYSSPSSSTISSLTKFNTACSSSPPASSFHTPSGSVSCLNDGRAYFGASSEGSRYKNRQSGKSMAASSIPMSSRSVTPVASEQTLKRSDTTVSDSVSVIVSQAFDALQIEESGPRGIIHSDINRLLVSCASSSSHSEFSPDIRFSLAEILTTTRTTSSRGVLEAVEASQWSRTRCFNNRSSSPKSDTTSCSEKGIP